MVAQESQLLNGKYFFSLLSTGINDIEMLILQMLSAIVVYSATDRFQLNQIVSILPHSLDTVVTLSHADINLLTHT